VTIPNPEHLLQQAEKLIGTVAPGQPRQVDMRRAISTAYYALFHATLTEAADNVIGARNRNTERYGLVYRSVNHDALRKLCEEVQKLKLTDKYRRFEPIGGFAPGIRAFAAAVIELQHKRHSADYDPLIRLSRTEARLVISGGRTALSRFKAASDEQRQIFANLLLFTPR
jgi:uncharacterized protein (UPF0332 family)